VATAPSVPEVDVLIHEPARLRVLALLAMVERADFMYLLRQTGLSRGNLSVQMSKLEAAGMVHLDRQLDGNRPRTTYFLSQRGLESLRVYKRTMLDLLAPFPG
jgi:DNA-binding transcriptional ArsR family regulator